MKDPPDKYQCLKVQINSILHKDNTNEENITILQDAVIRSNYITTKAYMLLRLWVLEKYHSGLDIPLITENTIKMAMKSIVKDSSGPKPKGNNSELLLEFKNLNIFELENGVNLSSILQYYQTTMLTAIENNIKMHFMDYINKFVKSYFKNMFIEEIEDKDFRKQFYKEMNILINDILNNTTNSNEKYHDWLLENRFKIVPKEYEISYFYDIKANPQKYLKYMIFMNIELENIEGKLFQFFPLQTQIIPRHIQIDTKSIVELFVKKDKKQYLDDIELNKEFLWVEFFNINQSLRKYEFDYTIITDGYAVSLRFINKNCIKEQQDKKNKMKNGRIAMSQLNE